MAWVQEPLGYDRGVEGQLTCVCRQADPAALQDMHVLGLQTLSLSCFGLNPSIRRIHTEWTTENVDPEQKFSRNGHMETAKSFLKK